MPDVRMSAFAVIALAAACAPTPSMAFEIGMSQSSAWELACERTRSGSLREGALFLQSGDQLPRPSEGSICDNREIAMSAEVWWVREPGFRDKYLIVMFSDGEIASVTERDRGFDP